MTLRKSYYPSGGQSQISDPDLSYVKILMISKSGMLYVSDDHVTWLSDNGLFCLHYVSLGVVEFGIPFNDGEDIEIVYKTI